MARIYHHNRLKHRSLPTLLTAAFVLLLAGAVGAELPCAYCGRDITDTYVEFNGQAYHSNCYHRHVAPRCAVCGEEIESNGVVSEDKHYHRSCYEDNVAVKCSVCGGIIEGEYLVDHWGNSYHKHHEREIASCSFCGRLFSDPAAGGGTDLDPIHKICNACAGTAVTEPDEAEKIVREILLWFEGLDIQIDPDAFEFKLQDRDDLASLTKQTAYDRFGLTRYEKVRYWGLLEETKLRLYVLQGLPRYHFMSAAAHELMHAWLFLNARYDSDDGESQMIEGSCNAAAWLVLDRMNDAMADYVVAQMELENDPVYGEGFRRAQRLILNRGVPYWLEHIRFDPEFPIGY